MQYKDRLIAATTHLVASIVLVGLILFVLYKIYFPGAVLIATGADTIFITIFLVDVCIGPLLTFAVFDKAKKELARDLMIIASLQIAALAYGVMSLYSARPVYAAFAVDRFELVQANNITEQDLKEASQTKFGRLHRNQFKWIFVASPNSYEERNKILMETLNGGPDLAQRPKYYQDYEVGIKEMLSAARPLSDLESANSDAKSSYEKAIDTYGDSSKYGTVPLSARTLDVAVVLELESGKVLDILNLTPWVQQ